jgi:hypothetical protein
MWGRGLDFGGGGQCLRTESAELSRGTNTAYKDSGPEGRGLLLLQVGRDTKAP